MMPYIWSICLDPAFSENKIHSYWFYSVLTFSPAFLWSASFIGLFYPVISILILSGRRGGPDLPGLCNDFLPLRGRCRRQLFSLFGRPLALNSGRCYHLPGPCYAFLPLRGRCRRQLFSLFGRPLALNSGRCCHLPGPCYAFLLLRWRCRHGTFSL